MGPTMIIMMEHQRRQLIFKFKPEHEYTVEKITAINWLYDAESANMNDDIKTKYSKWY